MVINYPWFQCQKKAVECLRPLLIHKVKYKAGTQILFQEECHNHIYIVLEGKLSTSVISRDGKKKTLSYHETGNILGEASAILGNASPINIEAVDDSVVAVFDLRDFLKECRRTPELFDFLLYSMARKIQMLTFQSSCAALLKNQQRIAANLLVLLQVQGVPCTCKNKICDRQHICKNGVIISSHITDDTIGTMLGIRREIVTKVLMKLRKEKYIRKTKNILCCPDLKQLKKYIESEE